MDRYIGIDVHSSGCTIAVVDAHGKRAGLHVVATNGQEIVECLAAIPGQRHMFFEEGTQSGWLYEVLEPHGVAVPDQQQRPAHGSQRDHRVQIHGTTGMAKKASRVTVSTIGR